ncbi:MAG: DMT family transporter [Alphaproteobacteria bacterium]
MTATTRPIGSWFEGLPGPLRGTAWMLMSAVSLTLMAAIIRHLSKDLHAFEIVLFRTALGFVFMAPWLASHGLSVLKTEKIGWYMLRAVMTAIAATGYFYALAEIPLADAVAIMFSRPLYGTIFAMVFLGELVGLRRWTATAIGFAGVLVMVRPGFETFNLGLASVLLASIAGAVSAVLIRYLSRTEPPDTITMYFVIFTTPIILVPALFVWETPSWEQLGWLVLMGFLGTLGQRAMSRGFASADASIMLPVDFSRLIFAALFGFLLFAEIPSVYTAIGALLIFSATVYNARREARPPSAAGDQTPPRT